MKNIEKLMLIQLKDGEQTVKPDSEPTFAQAHKSLEAMGYAESRQDGDNLIYTITKDGYDFVK